MAFLGSFSLEDKPKSVLILRTAKSIYLHVVLTNRQQWLFSSILEEFDDLRLPLDDRIPSVDFSRCHGCVEGCAKQGAASEKPIANFKFCKIQNHL